MDRRVVRRLITVGAVAAVLAGFGVVAGTANADDLVARFDWSMPDRTTADSRGVVTNITPSRRFISPDTWRVNLDACGSSPDIANFRWAVTLPDRVASFDTHDCRAFFDFPAERTYPVALTVTAFDGRVASTSRPVVVRNLLVVSLGDSLASGEGNPGNYFGTPDWADARCHRSGLSGPAKAARRLEQSDPHSSVTFVSVACSGAGILAGLVNQQAELTSQIEVAAGLLCPEGRSCNSRDDISMVDALLIQVGANDLHFSSIVERCAFPYLGFGEDCHKDANTLLRLHNDLAALPGRLDTLAEVLNAWLRFAGVYVPDYFDPTHGDNGQVCEDMKFDAPNSPDGHINRAEATWARDQVVAPLNNALVQASVRHGWSSLDFITDRFATHGYCAGDHWVVRYEESFAIQGDKEGTMHPNQAGHGVYRDRFFDALQPLLAG